MNTGDVWLLVVTIVLVLVAAVLAVAETAITRMSRARAAALVDQGRKGAERLERIVDNLERDLNAVYLTVNVVQVVQSALVGLLAGRLFGALGVAIGILLNVVVLFTVAEAAPKTWALQHPNRAALLTAPLVEWIGVIMRWPARALIGVANVILPGKGLRRGPFVTEEEILALAEEAAEAAVIEESERELIESIIDFGDTIVREVMIPRPDMVAIERHATVTEAVDLSIKRGFTRLPVVGEGVDDVVGVINVKEVVAAERAGRGGDHVAEVTHDAHFVPETKRVAELLAEMQADSVHIAIVVDEYGGTAGLVTLEDLLEELVGEITDEFDVDADPVQHLSDHEVLVNASLNVGHLNEELDLELPEEGWDSVGGLVFGTLGRVPEPGDAVEFDGVRVVVQRVDGRRIRRVRMYLPRQQAS
ncbi:MAG: HlyC/CorC family transporter [Actinomycetia bacterium]|nr:HlyC/CorC family transporter [Actinomycetes bacterium]